jgi:hypothetical protein
MDDKDVQKGAVSEGTESKGEVSTEETTSQVTKEGEVSQETTSKGKEAPELLTPEQVKEIVRESLAVEREKIKQSVADKTRFEVEQALRKAQIAEATLDKFAPELDEETRNKLELHRLRSKDAVYQTREQEEAARRQADEFFSTFNAQMTKFITDAGIDPDDKRIDWGKDAKDALEMQQRILSSVNKIQKENSKMAEQKLEQHLKEETAKMRKELGLDSVDTSTPQGTASNEDKWYAEYAQGEHDSPADHKRAKGILEKRTQGG